MMSQFHIRVLFSRRYNVYTYKLKEDNYLIYYNYLFFPYAVFAQVLLYF